MYLWKCWRDSRARFLSFLVIAIAVGMLSAWIGVETTRQQVTRTFVRGRGVEMIRNSDAWMLAVVGLISIAAPLMVVVGATFGVVGVGDELERGSGSFLLTRPRRRRHFVWTAAALGWLELFAFVCLLSLATFGMLCYYTREVATWRVFAPIPGLFVLGMLCHGLAQALATAGRNTRNAVYGTFAFALAYPLTVTWIRIALHWRIPTPTEMVYPWPGPAEIHLVPMFGWLAVALVFPLIQQLIVERVEV